MFTGIVEEIGRVERLDKRPGAVELVVSCQVVAVGAAVGDSISVEGVCLTITKAIQTELTFEAVPETIARTHFADLVVGQRVNLEAAMRMGRSFGGHYVQGHIDGCASIVKREPEGEALNVHFQMDRAHGRYLVKKGFVALDGVSLTLVTVTHEGALTHFSVTLVPHTQQVVTLANKPVGAKVNVEVDVHMKALMDAAGARFDDLAARVERLEAAQQQK